jgi:tetratricopeptide (TPR) repeat protein
LGQTLFDLGRLRARQGRDDEARQAWSEAVNEFNKTLAIDSENVTAHHNLQLLYAELGDSEKSREHERLHLRFKPDDNAQGRAERLARQRYPAANHAAEAVVKYPLRRNGAPGFQGGVVRGSLDPAPLQTGRHGGTVGRPATTVAGGAP